MADTSSKLTGGQRAAIFVTFGLGLVYLAFEIFEGLFNADFGFDELMGFGLAALTYVWLIVILKMNIWQTWTVVGLWVGVNAIDLLAPSGSMIDEVATVGALIAIFFLLFGGVIKRLRLAPVNE